MIGTPCILLIYRIMSFSSIHVAEEQEFFFFLRLNAIFCMHVQHFLYSVIHWWIFGLLSCLGTGNIDVLNMELQISLWAPEFNHYQYASRSMINRSDESSNFLGNLHTVLHSDIIHREILENMSLKIKNKTRMSTFCIYLTFYWF